MPGLLNIDELDQLSLDNEDDQKKLARQAQTMYDLGRPYVNRLSATWDENIRFFEGDHYIYYNETIRNFEVIPVTKYNSFIPRPVTNLILPICMTIASLMTRAKPTARPYPNSQEQSDVNAAMLGERILDAKWELDDEQLAHLDAVLIALLTGTCYRKDYWDGSAGLQSEIEGVGRIGDNKVEMLSPFEVIPDIEHDMYYIEARVQPLHYIRALYGEGMKGKEGYTGLGGEVPESRDLSTALSYRERLRTSTGSVRGGTSNSPQEVKDSAVVTEMYIAPTEKHKNGLMVVQAGGIPLYVNESPYYRNEVKDSWHPYTEFVWVKSPLKKHGISLVENLVPLQKRVNGIDSMIMLNRLTMCAPQWTVPHGSGVPEGFLDGRPGLNVFYRPVGANGARPERIQGIPLPPTVMEERIKIIQDMHIIAMDNEVLSGKQPSGVNTAAALQLLTEQSHSTFNPFIQRWEKFIERGQQAKLLMIQEKYREPRPQVIAMMKAQNKDTTEVEIKDFIGADLRDNIHVRIEAGSSLPRSKMVEQQHMMELAQAGLLGPLDPQQAPQQNQEFLERLGYPYIESLTNPDITKAKYVNSVLHKINNGELPPEAYEGVMLQEFEDLDIHMKVLTDEMKKPDFRDGEMPAFTDAEGLQIGAFKHRFNELMDAKNMQMSAQPAGGPEVPPEGMPPEGMPPGMGPEVPPQMEGEGPPLPPEMSPGEVLM